jgi:hypothetical protein
MYEQSQIYFKAEMFFINIIPQIYIIHTAQFLQSIYIYQPTYALNKMQFITSSKL